jgi:hypothetical protein
MRPDVVETRFTLSGFDRLGDGFHRDALSVVLFVVVDGPCFPVIGVTVPPHGLRSA